MATVRVTHINSKWQAIKHFSIREAGRLKATKPTGHPKRTAGDTKAFPASHIEIEMAMSSGGCAAGSLCIYKTKMSTNPCVDTHFSSKAVNFSTDIFLMKES